MVGPAGLLLVILAGLALAVPPASGATRVLGVGEQGSTMFSDLAWSSLGLRDVRLVVSWDATRNAFERREIDAYMAQARATDARVLVTFGRSRVSSKRRVLPTPARYRAAVRAFQRRWPHPTTFVAWNEANHCSQPTCNRPERAAAYFDALRSECPRCTVVAADVLDVPDMVPWLRRFRAAARHKPGIWGLHNYLDANRFTTKGTRELLRAVRGTVWFTETGGLVKRAPRSVIRFRPSLTHAARATEWVFRRLVPLSPRVRRVYLYQWRPGVDPNAVWDSGLVDRDGSPRPAYDVVRTWVSRFARR
jgi:hypothetical protein